MTARTTLWFFSMMSTGLLLLGLSAIGALGPVEDVSYTVLSPVEGLLRSIARPLADAITNYNDVRDLTRDNEALRTENERLQAEIARLQEEVQQKQQLERLLDVKRV
jgi:cell shape-determining protein MreC